MTKERWAEVLNGREYGSEVSSEEEDLLKADGLVVVFGASDDLVEIRGAIDDELGAWEGTEFKLDRKGVLVDWETWQDQDHTEAEYVDYFARKAGKSRTVKAEWDKDGYSWVISIDLPDQVVRTFDILEDGEKFCRGILFAIGDL